MSEYQGHFSLWGDFEPDEITKLLGLQPSAVYPKGEMWEGAEFPARVTTWDIHCPPDLSAIKQVRFLLNLLGPSADVLRRLSKQYTAEFNIACEGEPVLSFSTRDVQELAELGVGLNYFFHEDEAAEYVELKNQQLDLLVWQVPNEIINGFKVNDFQKTIGVSEEQARSAFKELQVRQADRSTSLNRHQASIYRSALAVVLQELGTEEFQTRTGHDYEFGQTLLKELAEFVSESQTQETV